jgi:hypothetical protein
MYRLTVLSAAILVTVCSVAGAQTQPKRLAGPWYTPQELKALIAYSNATFVEKQRILAGELRR